MGGKSSTQTSSVTVPPEVLARYSSVNARAEQVAQTPFQQYSTDPNAFVAPINAQQNQAISNINTAANQAQPYFTQATGTLNQAQAAAQPYYGAAGSDITGAQSVGSGLAGASLGSLLGGGAAAQPLQSAANSNYNAAYAGAQPYQGAATGLALAGAGQVNPGQLDIQRYLSPYLQDVLGSEAAVLNQNNQQQQAGQLGNAIRSGAFGGDRAGIAAANLEQQQNLANAQIYSGILNQGFNTALGAAQQQQGVGLGAAQANRAALQQAAGQLQGIGQQGFEQGLGLGQAQQGLGAQLFGQGATTAQQEAALGQQQFGQGLGAAQAQASLGQDVYGTGAATSAALANLGTGAQGAALQGAQAQLGAGTLQQQTTQAGDTALYNQFLQQQSYPFQVAQFLANIAEGTGALSGSTTTTNQPGSLFSDERLKEDVEPIGKTYDGQNIVAFRYKGEKAKRIGLIAQDVEKKHPDAVGSSQGYKTVDYDKATEDSAKRGHFALGGASGQGSGASYGANPLGGVLGMVASAIAGRGGQQQPQGAQTSSMGLNPMGAMPANGNAQIPQGSINPPIGLGIVSPDFDPLLRGGFARGGLAGANDNRQGYAFGGYPTIPGMSAGELQALIAQQQQMYAPFSQAGLYGGGLGAVRGGSSYVPQANLPVSSLAVSQVQPRSQESALATTKELTDLASNKAVNEGYNKLISLFRNNPGSVNTAFAGSRSGVAPQGDDVADGLLSDLTSLERRKGGRIGYDDGGSVDPYGDEQDTYGPHLHIPSDTQVRQLATAANPHPQQQQSGLSELGGLASGLGSAAKGIGALGSLFAPSMAGLGAAGGTALGAGLGATAAGASAAAGATGLEALAPFLLAFLKRGGRVGYAGGGATEPDLADESMQKLLMGLVKGDDTEAPPGATDQDSAPQPASFAAPAGGLGGASSTTIAPKAPPTGLAAAVPALATAQGLPNTLDKIMPLISRIEGNATGPSKYSTAQGQYGITDPAFVGLFKEMYPQRASSMSKGDILALRHTPEGPQLQSEMGPFLAKENIAKFQKVGIPPSAPNIYLAHFLGAPEAIKLLRSDPSTPVSEVLPSSFITANPTILQGKTVGDVQNWSARRLSQVQSQLARQPRARGGLADGGDPDDVSGVVNTAFSDAQPKDAPPPPAPQGLAAAQRPIDDGAAFPPVQMGAGDPSQHQGAHGFIDRLKQPEIFIPLLTGLAAAAAAPTRNPLTALAVGAGSAGQAYQAQRAFEQQQQQISQHGAEVNVMQQALGLRPFQLQTERIAALGPMLSQAQAAFEQGYQPLTTIGKDGLPQYADKSNHGQPIDASEYRARQMQFYRSMFGDLGTGQLPIDAVLQPHATGSDPVLPQPVSGASASNVGPGNVSDGRGANNPVAPPPQPRRPVPRPPVAAPQAQPLAPNATLGQKVLGGYYQYRPTPLPEVDPSQVNPDDTPEALTTHAKQLQAVGNTAFAQQLLDRANQISNGQIPAHGPNGDYWGYRDRAAAQAANNQAQADMQAQKTQVNAEAGHFAAEYPVLRQALSALERVYQGTPTNRLSPDWADAIGQLRSIPGMEKVIPENWKQIEAGNDESAKQSMRLAIVQAGINGLIQGAPASGLAATRVTIPDATKDPAARYDMIVQNEALLDQMKDFYHDWGQFQPHVSDVNKLKTDWFSNPNRAINVYETNAYNRVVPFAGMSQDQMWKHPRLVQTPDQLKGMPSGIPYVITTGKYKGRTGVTP